jgi:hypothetical protein
VSLKPTRGTFLQVRPSWGLRFNLGLILIPTGRVPDDVFGDFLAGLGSSCMRRLPCPLIRVCGKTGESAPGERPGGGEREWTGRQLDQITLMTRLKKWKFYLLTVGVYIYVCDYIGKYELHDIYVMQRWLYVRRRYMHAYIYSKLSDDMSTSLLCSYDIVYVIRLPKHISRIVSSFIT